MLGLVSSVVEVLGFDWWDVAAVLVESAVIEPVDPFGGGIFEVLDGLPGLAWLDQFGLDRPLIVSARALSKLSPTVPTEAAIPASARRSV